MKTKKVLDHSNFRPKIPVVWSLLVILICDRFNATDLVWGIALTVISIINICAICLICAFNYEKVKLFPENDEPEPPKKTWEQRLKEVQDLQNKHRNQ